MNNFEKFNFIYNHNEYSKISDLFEALSLINPPHNNELYKTVCNQNIETVLLQSNKSTMRYCFDDIYNVNILLATLDILESIKYINIRVPLRKLLRLFRLEKYDYKSCLPIVSNIISTISIDKPLVLIPQNIELLTDKLKVIYSHDDLNSKGHDETAHFNSFIKLGNHLYKKNVFPYQMHSLNSSRSSEKKYLRYYINYNDIPEILSLFMFFDGRIDGLHNKSKNTVLSIDSYISVLDIIFDYYINNNCYSAESIIHRYRLEKIFHFSELKNLQDDLENIDGTCNISENIKKICGIPYSDLLTIPDILKSEIIDNHTLANSIINFSILGSIWFLKFSLINAFYGTKHYDYKSIDEVINTIHKITNDFIDLSSEQIMILRLREILNPEINEKNELDIVAAEKMIIDSLIQYDYFKEYYLSPYNDTMKLKIKNTLTKSFVWDHICDKYDLKYFKGK